MTNSNSDKSFSEQPANRMLVQRKCNCRNVKSKSNGGCSNCKKKKKRLQRTTSNYSAARYAPSIVNQVIGSSGMKLDNRTLGSMESSFGTDFRKVRVHTDSTAAKSANAVNARAYTAGSNVVFGAGQYRPGTSSGNQLLAHELTHVIQQRNGLGSNSAALEIGPTNDQYERQADAAANAIARGGRLDSGQISGSSGAMQRKPHDMMLEVYLPRIEEHADHYVMYPDVDILFEQLEGLDLSETDRLDAVTAKINSIWGSGAAKDFRKKVNTELSVWRTVDKIGVVKTAGERPKGGANVRSAPGGKLLKWLPQNTRVFIHRSQKRRWLEISVIGGDYDGLKGYVADWLIWTNLPDPDAVLYEVKPGDTLGAVVETQFKNFDWGTGNDARVLALAVYLANRGRGTRGNIILNEKKLEAARKDAGILDAADDFRAKLRPIFQSVELRRPGKNIWLPGLGFVESLKKEGAIPQRSGWKNATIGATKGAVGFAKGIVTGFSQSIIDVFTGVVDLAKMAYDTLKSVVSGEAFSMARELIDAFEEMTLDDLKQIANEAATAIGGMLRSTARSFTKNWNAHNTHDKWQFRGKVIGYILAEIAMLIFSAGALTAIKWLGKLSKIGGKLGRVVNKIASKLPGRKGKPDVDMDSNRKTGSKKSRQLPAAIIAAKAIVEGHDTKDSSVSTAKVSASVLKSKYNWIKRFSSKPIGPGKYQVWMHASKHLIDADYTPGPEKPESKKETVEEFQNRGGQITKVPDEKPPKQITAQPKDKVDDLPEGTHGTKSANEARIKVVHDLGVKHGSSKAINDGLQRNMPGSSKSWENPFEFSGPFGKGFDDIMFDGKGNPVILEYKGGTSQLAKGQMSTKWVKRKIKQLRSRNDPMADVLSKALKENRLTGRVYRTPVDERGLPKKAFMDGDVIKY